MVVQVLVEVVAVGPPLEPISGPGADLEQSSVLSEEQNIKTLLSRRRLPITHSRLPILPPMSSAPPAPPPPAESTPASEALQLLDAFERDVAAKREENRALERELLELRRETAEAERASRTIDGELAAIALAKARADATIARRRAARAEALEALDRGEMRLVEPSATAPRLPGGVSPPRGTLPEAERQLRRLVLARRRRDALEAYRDEHRAKVEAHDAKCAAELELIAEVRRDAEAELAASEKALEAAEARDEAAKEALECALADRAEADARLERETETLRAKCERLGREADAFDAECAKTEAENAELDEQIAALEETLARREAEERVDAREEDAERSAPKVGEGGFDPSPFLVPRGEERRRKSRRFA